MAESPKPKSELHRLTALALSDRRTVAKAVTFQILQALTYIPFTAGLGWFVDHVLMKGKGVWWIMGYALVNLFWWPVHSFCTVRAFAHTQTIIRQTVARLRRMTVDNLQRLSMSFFARQGAGALSNKVTVDMARLESFLSVISNQCFISLTMGIGTLVYLFVLNARLALLSLIFVPVQFGIIRLMRDHLKQLNRNMQQKNENFSDHMVEFISGMRLIKSFGNEELMSARLAQTIEHLRAAGYEASIATRWMLMWLQMTNQYLPVLVWSAGGYMYLHQQASLGQLIVFTGLLVYVQGGFNAIQGAIEQWLPTKPGVQALFEILDSSEIENYSRPNQTVKLRGEVNMTSVTFRYPGTTEPALRDINVYIPAGQRVGLVGETGAGKSTFVDLVLGFYQPSEGSITWDSRELKEIGSLQLRRATAIMSQEAFLWNDSIRENIRFGRSNASEAEIIEAAQKAQAHEFILRQERGYDTRCGERGGRLSGGQRQRIALARIFLRNPAFVVLDEPTSALDVETEVRLQNELEVLCAGRTTLIVAHRLSTLRFADRILVFSNGRIVEDGPVDELIRREGGIFRRMHSLQTI